MIDKLGILTLEMLSGPHGDQDVAQLVGQVRMIEAFPKKPSTCSTGSTMRKNMLIKHRVRETQQNEREQKELK